MNGRRWHVAHADGREWTRGEMDSLVEDATPTFLVDMGGRLWIGDAAGFDPMPHELTERLDMRVVWDE